MRLAKGDKWQSLDLIFPTGKGTPASHIASKKWHLGIVEAGGLRYVSLHTLRKTGTTILETEIGASREEVQAALRHKRPTVIDVYVAYKVEQRRQHIDKLAALITDGVPITCPQIRSILAASG